MKHEETKEPAPRRWERKEIMMTVLIGVLVLIAGLQTVQLTGLASAQVAVPAGASAAPAKTSAASTPSMPANIQNLPSMVGGC